MEVLTNYKGTGQDIQENGVQAVQGEVLYGDPSENKKLFDRLVTPAIGKVNAALDRLVDKAPIHDNKDLIDTIAADNVHAHANKTLPDTVEPDNVHAHTNKSILDTLTKPSSVHEHANKGLIDTIVEANVHAHANKSLLDTIGEDNVHKHPNKTAPDQMTVNLITKWNQASGAVEGSTDFDYGAFVGQHSRLQIRRGEEADLPVPAEGEPALAGRTLYMGTAEGNRAMADRAEVDSELSALLNYVNRETTVLTGDLADIAFQLDIKGLVDTDGLEHVAVDWIDSAQAVQIISGLYGNNRVYI